jgi:cardiolipin synthase
VGLDRRVVPIAFRALDNVLMATAAPPRQRRPFDQFADDPGHGPAPDRDEARRRRTRRRALLGHRLAAWLIDTGLLMTLQVGAFLGLSILLDRFDSTTTDVMSRYEISKPFLDAVIAATLLVALPLVYRVVFDRLWYGQTLGKYCFGLQVVRRTTGEVPGFGRCVVRELMRIPSLLTGGLGFAVALVNRQRLTFCDLVAGTVVLPSEEAALRRQVSDGGLLDSRRVTGASVGPVAAAPVVPAETGVLTLPNVISVVRLCLVPAFLYLLFGRDNRAAAAYMLGALGATDWIDGYIARHFHQVSTLGKVLDPVADRILLGVAIVAIMIDNSVPLWIGWLALVREVLVSGAVVTLAVLGARRVDVTWVGKAGTFGLMFAFPLFLAGNADNLGWDEIAGVLAWLCAVPALILSWYAAITYVPLARAALREGREAPVS